jgi:hypothetical protein
MGGQVDGRHRLCVVSRGSCPHTSFWALDVSRNRYLAGQHSVFEMMQFARYVSYDFSMCFVLPGDISVPA